MITSPPPGQPMVTVIVLTYNHAAFVEQAVGSVLDQETPWPVRIVVHDDASTDGTRDIVRRIAADNPGRLELVLQNSNTLSTGRNPSVEILREVATPYVAWCEGDDWWTDQLKLRRQVEFMDASPWCAVSHHEVEIVVEPGGSTEYGRDLGELLAQPWRRSRRIPGTRIAQGNFIMTCSAMVRRDRLRDRALAAVFDVQPGDLVTFALALEGGDVGFLPQTMAAYRIHGDNMWARPAEARLSPDNDRALWFLATFAQDPIRSAVRETLVRGGVLDDQDSRVSTDQLAALRRENDRLSEQVTAVSRDLAEIRESRGWRALERVRSLGHRVRRRQDPGGR